MVDYMSNKELQVQWEKQWIQRSIILVCVKVGKNPKISVQYTVLRIFISNEKFIRKDVEA